MATNLTLRQETGTGGDVTKGSALTWKEIDDNFKALKLTADAAISQLTGDVTTSTGGGSQAATIANNAVTLAKFQQIATDSFLGRDTAATGNVEVLSVATVKTLLNLTGTNSGDQTITLTGDVTGTGTGSFATTIGANKVTLSMMATMATASFLGRNTAAVGNVEVLSTSTVRTMLSINNVENTALSTWVGSSAITTLGTIGSGTWQGGVINSTYGGTGVNNGGRTLTLNTNSGTIAFSAASKTLTISNTLILTATDGSTLAIGTGGTLGTAAYTASTAYLSSSTSSTQSGYFGDIYLYDDSTPSHYLQITNSANLTLARTLSINVNDANRTISLSGDLTVSGAATISGTNTGDQTIGNATLTMSVSGSGLSGSQTFTANATSGATFTVTSNATSAKTANTIVFRGASGDFIAGDITTHRDTAAGVIYLGNQSGGSRYLYYDTSNYNMPGANLYINSSLALTSANYNSYALPLGGGTLTGQLISTYDGGTSNGNIFLNATTRNSIIWNGTGVAVPSFSTRSVGAKLVLYPAIGVSSADYALGISSGALWFGVPSTSQQFEFYAGTTSLGTWSNSGLFFWGSTYYIVSSLWYCPALTSKGLLTINTTISTNFKSETTDNNNYWNMTSGASLDYTLELSATRTGAATGAYYLGGNHTTTYYWRSGSYTTRMTLDTSGNLTATGNVTAYSDVTLKENIQQLENSLDIIRQLRGVSFTWKETKKRSLGMIAQEVEKIVPNLVVESDSHGPDKPELNRKIKSLDYSRLSCLLIEAMKEQDTIIKEQGKKIEELERKLQ